MTSFNLFTFFQSEVQDSFQLSSDWIIHVNLQERIILMRINQERSHFRAFSCSGGHNNRFNPNFMNYFASLGIFMHQGHRKQR